MNTTIDFSTAKLLKEKGFNKLCDFLWYFNGSDCIKMINKNSENFGFSAPTIAEAMMWLYEKHGIWINVYEYKDHAADVNDSYVFRTSHTKLKEFNSPTEAYQEAIEYTLKHLI
jgi:hypothetical protein